MNKIFKKNQIEKTFDLLGNTSKVISNRVISIGKIKKDKLKEYESRLKSLIKLAVGFT